jgi:hypothetical protein
MWVVSSPSSLSVPAHVELDTRDYGIGFPSGWLNGEKHTGFAFYHAIERVIDGKKVACEKYISYRIRMFPILVAVTKAQYASWKKKKIIAKPVIFLWKEMRISA